MKKIKPLIIVDPFPRSLDLIFTKSNLNYLKSNFILMETPKKKQKKILHRKYSFSYFYHWATSSTKRDFI